MSLATHAADVRPYVPLGRQAINYDVIADTTERVGVVVAEQAIHLFCLLSQNKVTSYQRRCKESFRGQSVVNEELVLSTMGRGQLSIHLQQTLICCTACLQAPSILGCSIDISGCSTIVSHINHPAEPLETILIGLWWW